MIEAEDSEQAISHPVGQLQDPPKDGSHSLRPPILVLLTWHSRSYCHASKPQTRQMMKESVTAEAVEMKHGKLPQSNGVERPLEIHVNGPIGHSNVQHTTRAEYPPCLPKHAERVTQMIEDIDQRHRVG